MRKTKSKNFIFTALLWTFLAVAVSPVVNLCYGVTEAKADLLVTPVRVAFEGRERQAVVTLINNSTKTNTYRMEWKAFRMGADGKYQDIPEDDKSDFAERARKMAKMVRFSPRQVTIEPGGRQRVRLSLRRTEDLQDGEYRAHLSFSKLPEIPEPTETVVKGAQFKLYVNLSFTIPVIYTHGEKNTDVDISGIALDPPAEHNRNKLSLNITLDRKGSNSSYGRLHAFWSPPGGSERKIGILNNVAVYTERDQRVMTMPLDVDAVSGGQIRVVYDGDGEFKGQIWDEKVFPVAN